VAETLTTNYKWTKPELQHSPSTWGSFLNQDLDAIDALVFANQQGLVPIGSMTLFAGPSAPANWLLCNGQALSTAAPYDKLFNVIQYAFGGAGTSFNLPNLTQRFPLGTGPNALGTAGGALSQNVSIGVANLPSHSHPIADVAHGHGVNQWAHGHGIATGSHSHGITTGTHSHGIPTQILTASAGGNAPGGAGWAFSASVRTDTAGNLGGNTDTAGNLGGNADTQTSSISIQASGTGLSTTQPTGSGTPLNVPTVPPWLAINFIIRYQ